MLRSNYSIKKERSVFRDIASRCIGLDFNRLNGLLELMVIRSVRSGLKLSRVLLLNGVPRIYAHIYENNICVVCIFIYFFQLVFELLNLFGSHPALTIQEVIRNWVNKDNYF